MQGEKNPPRNRKNQHNAGKGTQSEEKYIWFLRSQERLHDEGDICKRP